MPAHQFDWKPAAMPLFLKTTQASCFCLQTMSQTWRGVMAHSLGRGEGRCWGQCVHLETSSPQTRMTSVSFNLGWWRWKQIMPQWWVCPLPTWWRALGWSIFLHLTSVKLFSALSTDVLYLIISEGHSWCGASTSLDIKVKQAEGWKIHSRFYMVFSVFSKSSWSRRIKCELKWAYLPEDLRANVRSRWRISKGLENEIKACCGYNLKALWTNIKLISERIKTSPSLKWVRPFAQ